MVTRCVFGIFVFGSDSDLIYRFITDDLFAHLQKHFIDRDVKYNDNPTEQTDINQDIDLSFDDAIILQISTLMNFYSQTVYRKNPVRRVTLTSNMELYFDHFGDSRIICMADESFNSVVVLKAMNLLKALVKFHMGVLPFTHKKSRVKSIDQISATLQYYLNNIRADQALIFESCEYLHINALVRQQCLETCTLVNQDFQRWLHTTPSVVLITCKDKIVYIHTSNNQNRPSNSDLFLLILNNISRSLREQFQKQKNVSTSKVSHIYKTKTLPNHHDFTQSAEATPTTNDYRTNSLPTFTRSKSLSINDNSSIEIVFMKTSNRNLAPFTMYTIQLTDDISVLVLIEWKSSATCSHISELMRQLDLCTSQSQFMYSRLNNLVKPIESNTIVRQYLSGKNRSSIFSRTLNEIKTTYNLLKKETMSKSSNEDNEKVHQISKRFSIINNLLIDVFYYLFFDLNEYVVLNNDENEQKKLSNSNNSLSESSTMTESLRNKVSNKLQDWFSFIEIKAQRNITMSFCNNDFPGLVHFALIDRLHGHIYTPALYTNDTQSYSASDNMTSGMEQVLEKKILKFELDCLSALQRGCTSYTMTDEHFTYNYTLRLQEDNGASMRIYKPFIKSQVPSILHYDFYRALAHENYASIVDQTQVACFELICVHLRIVPASSVREQCEQLWPKLMEPEE